MKPNRLWAVCLAALVVLAGCVGLPRSGRVNSVSPSKTSSGAIGFAVQPPARTSPWLANTSTATPPPTGSPSPG